MRYHPLSPWSRRPIPSQCRRQAPFKMDASHLLKRSLPPDSFGCQAPFQMELGVRFIWASGSKKSGAWLPIQSDARLQNILSLFSILFWMPGFEKCSRWSQASPNICMPGSFEFGLSRGICHPRRHWMAEGVQNTFYLRRSVLWTHLYFLIQTNCLYWIHYYLVVL